MKKEKWMLVMLVILSILTGIIALLLFNDDSFTYLGLSIIFFALSLSYHYAYFKK